MKQEINIFIILLCISGIVSCFLGADMSWDFLSYHYYNAYAVLNDRIGVDIMPAGIQSYLNPLLDIIDYSIINIFRFNTKIVLFLLGLPYGCFVFVLYLINKNIFNKISNDKIIKETLIIFATIIGATECFIVSEIGLANHDIHIGIFILLGVLFALKYLETQKIKNLNFSGFFVGIACGLKLTAIPYCIALLVAFLIFNIKNGYKKLLYNMLLLIIFVSIGFLIIDGYWLYILWQKFHNPIFPLYNGIFKSDLYTPINYHDIRSYGVNLFKILHYPLIWSYIALNHVSEMPFFDLRHSITYICIFCSIIWFTIKSKIIRDNLSSDKIFIFIVIFMIFSYLFWVKMFGILRYFIPILGLTGTIIVYTLSQIRWIINNKRNIFIIISILFALFFINYQVPDWGRSNNLISVPNLMLKDDSIVFIYGKPLSFIAARKYKNTRFVYLYDDIDGSDKKFRPSDKYYEYIDSIAKNKQKYILIGNNEYKKNDIIHRFIKDKYINHYDLECSYRMVHHYTIVKFCIYPN